MCLRPVIWREFVRQTVGLAEIGCALDAGLFPELAQRGIAQILALVDAALRHLPVEARQDDLGSVALEAVSDQHAAIGIEQRDSDIGTVGFFSGHAWISRRHFSD